jgi:hypothetical protein
MTRTFITFTLHKLLLLFWRGITVPCTATISDVLYVPIWVLTIPDLSIRAVWQLPAETSSSEAGETWRELAVNFSSEVYLSYLLGSFNMLENLTKWDRRLYFPSEGRRATIKTRVKINRPGVGLNPRILVRMASTLTTRSPTAMRWQINTF